MKKLYSITLMTMMFFTSQIYSQTTVIPDMNFEALLLDLGIDNDGPGNGTVLTADVDTLTYLDISYSSLIDLTGIEDFASLTTLLCNNNSLTNLDLTQNSNLTTLNCNNNSLTNLDLTQNSNLTTLNCNNNSLTNLDLPQNTNNLTTLYCTNNQISSLNVTQNLNLITLWCDYNLIISLDLSQNSNLTTINCKYNSLTCLNLKNGNNINIGYMYARYNPNLTCIDVDNVSYSTTNWGFGIDPQTSFSTNCNNSCSTSTTSIETSNVSENYNISSYNKNIVVKSNDFKDYTVTVYNLNGQVIFNKTSIGNDEFSLDVSKGMYIVNITNSTNSFNHKIIIQ